MLKIVIHADDFGISSDVNECIDKCFLAGELSETSIMVNMSAAGEAIGMARRAGYDTRVGLHLNLTQGIPLTQEIRSCRCFCDRNGVFNKVFHLSTMKRLWLNSRELKALEGEVKAQLERFCDYGGLMMKIDSHHHVHTDMPVFGALCKLAPRYGFTDMRLSANVADYGIVKRLYKNILNGKMRRVFRTTEWFCGIKDAARYGRQLDDGIMELMVHPLFSKDRRILDTNIPYQETINILRRMDNAVINDWRSMCS